MTNPSNQGIAGPETMPESNFKRFDFDRMSVSTKMRLLISASGVFS